MGWAINLAGNLPGIRKELAAASTEVDRVQLPVVRDFINGALDRLPRQTSGVVVKAYGHRESNVYQLTIKIQPIQLALEIAEPVPEEPVPDPKTEPTPEPGPISPGRG